MWGLCRGGLPRRLAGSSIVYGDEHPRGNTARLLSCGLNDGLQYELLCRGISVLAAGGAVRPGEKWPPFQVLLRLSSCSLPASLGGWWPCSAVDLLSYRLKFDPTAVSSHPVLSRLTELNNYNALALLIAAGDPRRFIDPVKPFSSSRFKAFVGLRPRKLRCQQAHPFLCCLDAWSELSPADAIRDTSNFAEFVWRHWLQLVAGGSRHNP